MNELLDENGVLLPWAREVFYETNGLVYLPLVNTTPGVTVEQLKAKETPRTAKTTLSLEEFQFHYQFGKFPNVRLWIKYFHELGLGLTQEDLYEYVTRSDGSAFDERHRKKLPRVNVY